MAHKFKLSKEVIADLTDAKDRLYDMRSEIELLAETVRAEHDQHQEAWDARSESWQQGERGGATTDWLDRIDGLAQLLLDVCDATEKAGDEILDFPEEPEYL